MAEPMTAPISEMSFADWLAGKLGTRAWVLASRMTEGLRRRGYTRAISAAQYARYDHEYQVEKYGAPMQSLLLAAPEMFAALRVVDGFPCHVCGLGYGKHNRACPVGKAIAKATAGGSR